MQKVHLDKPFPIKYIPKKSKSKMIWVEFLVSGWEQHSIWPMSGLPYIETLSKVDKKQAVFHLKQYERLIKKYMTFIEVYDSKGKPYVSLVYSSDEGMIWCASWLSMKKHF